MERILSIDPGGTTGLYFTNGKQEEFLEINKKDWKENYNSISQLVKEKKINLVIYEDTNYIHKKTKDGLSLFRLLGAIEFLEVEQVKSINVLKVKELGKQLLAGKEKIKDLEYKIGRGKGWMFKDKRISKHCLDAYLIWWLWSKKII